MKIRLALLIVPILLIGGFLITPVAAAHVLKADGQIGGIFHIEPDDSATSGEPTQYTIYFSDQSHRLDLNNCDCGVSLSENNKTIFTAPLMATGSLVSVDTITFPKPDVYYLTVSGKPKNSATFQAFSITYEVRATASTSTDMPTTIPPLFYIGVSLGMALILLAAFSREYTTKTTNKKE